MLIAFLLTALIVVILFGKEIKALISLAFGILFAIVIWSFWWGKLLILVGIPLIFIAGFIQGKRESEFLDND